MDNDWTEEEREQIRVRLGCPTTKYSVFEFYVQLAIVMLVSIAMVARPIFDLYYP